MREELIRAIRTLLITRSSAEIKEFGFHDETVS